MQNFILSFTVLLFFSSAHAAKVGGTYTKRLGAEPTTLHPLNSTDGYSGVVHSYTLDSLFTRDPNTYEQKPALAEKVESSKDGLEHIITLREGAKFHDGSPVTVEDVKFSFDAIWDDRFQTAASRPYYENIGVPEILDSRRLKFKFKQKYILNLSVLGSTPILPKHVYQDAENKKLNKTVIGTGPYIFDSYDRGSKIILKRNPNWYGFKLPENKDKWNFETIVLKIVKEENVYMEMFKKGDLDSVDLSPEQYMLKAVGPEWGSKLIKVKAENKEPKPYGFIAWNFKTDLLNDKNVRMALAYLINRPLMNEKFRFNMSLLATGPIYPLSEYHSPNVKPIPFDSKKALDLLKKVGWADSDKDGILDKQINGEKKSLSFTILNANEDSNKYLTVFKEDAKKVGVDIQIKVIEWNSFVKLLDEHKFEAVTLGWGAGSIEWDGKQTWHSSSIANAGSNFISYSNPEVDKLIDQARMELDKKKRIPLTRKIDELIAADAPYAFLFTPKYILYAHNARIKKLKDIYNYTIGEEFWWVE